MKDLCDHFQVTLTNAHDARADSAALAECVAEALRRCVMLSPRETDELQPYTGQSPEKAMKKVQEPTPKPKPEA